MKYTGNYNLKKPEGSDVVNIEDLNDNADIIDQQLKTNADNIATKETPAGAQSKADIAESNAKTYADGVGSAAVTAANTYTDQEVGEVANELTSHKNDKVAHIDYAVASGTNTYTANIQGITALVEGLSVKIKFQNANTGASTLNINGLGAKEIRKSNGNALSSGNIKAGQICHLVYTGSNFQLLGEGGEGNAQPGDVIKGKTFTNDNDVQVGTLDLSNLKPENLKFGITINGITGDKLKYGVGDFIPKPNYKENANKIWSYTNNDPVFGTAITAMTVGKYSEAFICSNGGIIRKISSNGGVIWSIKENLGLGAITIDTTGYIFFVGRDDGKIEEIYCDDGGRKAVYERHAGAVNAIAMCGAGAICSGSDDGWICKTYTGGTSVWSLSYGDEVEAIATDDDENTWAAGYNYLMKIDTNGNLLWKKSISAGTIRSIATDDDGNAYIGDSGGFVWKIAPDGSTILAIKINTGTIYSIMIDEKNNIYTASADAQVIKKDRDGDTIWSLATGGTTGWPPKMQKALDSDKFYYAICNELNKIDQGVTLT